MRSHRLKAGAVAARGDKPGVDYANDYPGAIRGPQRHRRAAL
jgi:hypothetical protein